MGLRSWFTNVERPGEWDLLRKAISTNPIANRGSYIIDIGDDTPGLPKGIWVAWSGDGNSSLTEYMPDMFIDRTLYLDAVLDQFPAFHYGNGPEDYGKYLKSGEVEPLLAERSHDTCAT